MNKLSKREMMLVIILINLVGYYILFNVIGLSISSINKTKLESYEELKAQKDILEIENKKNEINEQNLQTLTKESEELKKQIFSYTNPENIHYFLNQNIEKCNLVLNSINIEKQALEEDTTNEENNDTPTENTVENNDTPTEDTVENEEQTQQEEKTEEQNQNKDMRDVTYNIELEILGKYEDKLKFIKNIESLGKTLAITDFSTSFKGDNSISKIKMKLYTITKDMMDSEFIIK